MNTKFTSNVVENGIFQTTYKFSKMLHFPLAFLLSFSILKYFLCNQLQKSFTKRNRGFSAWHLVPSVQILPLCVTQAMRKCPPSSSATAALRLA